MQKPGRNDPCYCGSGKKYKQCHMPIDQEAERQQRSRADAARFLRRDLMAFARDERFSAAFAQALPFYWNGLYELKNAEEMSQPEALRFFDWFVFDYTLDDGSRLIEHYHAEKREDLSSYQQAVLDEWLTAGPAGAYELVGYDGQTLTLRDFMTGQTYTVYEAGGRGNVEIGEVILTRLLPVNDRLEFSTTAAYLPKEEIADLADKLEAAKAADAQTHPDAIHDDFMRRHNHLLIHHALEQAELQNRPAVARLDTHRTDKVVQKVARSMKTRIKQPQTINDARPSTPVRRKTG